ncbi:MAG: DUF4382 domain-containing protein [Bdellovibrio sp.]
MNTLGRKVSVFMVFAMMAACSQTSKNSSGTSSLDPQTQAKVSFKLTDAPNQSLKSVFVNIDHMEVVVAGNGKAGRLILAQGLGMVDLLTLQNGVTMNLHDIVAPEGIQIQQIRLVLKQDGHYAVKTDDSICELKTPSADKTGVKIILTNKVQFEAGQEYSIVVDFDAQKSVVIEGNGNCLLKPVLKLKSAFKKPMEDQCLLAKNSASKHNEGNKQDDDQNTEKEGSESSNQQVSGNDDDSTKPKNDVQVVSSPCPAPTPAPAPDTSAANTDQSTSTDPASTPADSTSTAGQELAVNPDQNDTTASDGWDYVPVVDGATPVVTQDQLGALL